MSDENGSVTEEQSEKVVATRSRSTKTMSDKAKDRIEKLINDKAGDLTSHLDSLKHSTIAGLEELPFSGEDQIKKLEEDKHVLSQQLEQLSSIKTEKLADVDFALEQQYKRRLERVKRVENEINNRWKKAKEEAKHIVNQEHADEFDRLNREIAALNSKQADLQRNKRAEQVVRKAAVEHMFLKLSGQIKDGRNKAVERIWIATETTQDAEKAVEMLPDAVSFREKVNPTLLVGVLNGFVDRKQLTSDKICCKYCKSTNVDYDASYGYMVCKNCSKRDVTDTDKVVETIALPSLEDIVKEPKKVVSSEEKKCNGLSDAPVSTTHIGSGNSTQENGHDSNSLSTTANI